MLVYITVIFINFFALIGKITVKNAPSQPGQSTQVPHPTLRSASRGRVAPAEHLLQPLRPDGVRRRDPILQRRLVPLQHPPPVLGARRDQGAAAADCGLLPRNDDQEPQGIA